MKFVDLIIIYQKTFFVTLGKTIVTNNVYLDNLCCSKVFCLFPHFNEILQWINTNYIDALCGMNYMKCMICCFYEMLKIYFGNELLFKVPYQFMKHFQRNVISHFISAHFHTP